MRSTLDLKRTAEPSSSYTARSQVTVFSLFEQTLTLGLITAARPTSAAHVLVGSVNMNVEATVEKAGSSAEKQRMARRPDEIGLAEETIIVETA